MEVAGIWKLRLVGTTLQSTKLTQVPWKGKWFVITFYLFGLQLLFEDNILADNPYNNPYKATSNTSYMYSL